ncbi:MAG: hypothetical protein IMX01_08425 [Limnochordaceae bacterium]|nr:hypothetical protein [Limnochordaceae bacterium]
MKPLLRGAVGIGLMAAIAVGSPQTFAAGLSISGSGKVTLRYSPAYDSKWVGETYLLLSLGTSNIYLRWYETTQQFWNPFGEITLPPSSIALNATGPLWTGGPSISGTLGDYRINGLGPDYLFGPTGWPPADALRGVLARDLKVGKLTMSGFFGWPTYNQSNTTPIIQIGPTAMAWGASLNLPEFAGIKTNLYGAMRVGTLSVRSVVTVVQANKPHDQWPMAVITRVNPTDTGQNGDLLLFSQDAPKAPKEIIPSPYWAYAFLDKDFKVINTQYGDPRPDKPSGNVAYILAGHDYQDPTPPYAPNGPQNASWITTYLHPGDTVRFENGPGKQVDPVHPDKAPGSEAFGGIELQGKHANVSWSLKAARQVVVDPNPVAYPKMLPYQQFTAGMYMASASTTLEVPGKELATKPLQLTLDWRNIDANFHPWPSSTQTDPTQSYYNYVYAHRDQQGIHFNAKTTVFPAQPVDLTLDTDSYTKKSAPTAGTTRSYSLTAATTLRGYSFTSTLSSDATSIQVSRSLPAVGPISSITPTYKLTFATPLKHEVQVDVKLSVGGFRDISTTTNYTAQGSNTTTSIQASYTSPNGWALAGKWTGWSDPTKKPTVDDNYATVSYSLSF